MWFHAKLRLSEERYSDKDRREKIDTVLHELGLTKCQGVLIGGQSGDHVGKKTLSGGERKRLGFATEVLTNPSVFFCDEPTTGLDSFMAETVVQSMKNLAERGKTVVCTLHQPSSEIISLLDDLLVLSDGKVVYHGPTKEVVNYFESIGYPSPPSFNPFDHVIAVLSTPSNEERQRVIPDSATPTSGLSRAEAMAETFRRSKNYRWLVEDMKTSNAMYANKGQSTMLEQRIAAGLEPASVWSQYKMAIWRQVITVKRNKATFAGRIFSTLFLGSFYSLMYADQKYDDKGVMNFVAIMYQMSTLACWENLEPYAVTIPKEVPIYMREQQQNMYSPLAYFIARTVIEIPQIFMTCLAFVTLTYLSSNLLREPDRFFNAVFINCLSGWTASGLGTLIGFSVDNLAISNGIRRAIGPLLSYTAGMYINLAGMPPYIAWLRYISPTFYANELMQINQWTGVDHLDCTLPDESSCFKNGDQVMDFYGFSPDDVTRNIVALIGLMIAFRIIAFIILTVRTNRTKNEA